MRRALIEGEASVVIGVPRIYNALYTGLSGRLREKGRIVGGLFSGLIALSASLRRRFGWRAGRVLLKPLHSQMGGRLRLLCSGGAPLDERLAQRLEGIGWEVAIGYGLTETAPLLTLHGPGEGHLGSVGRPIKGVEIRLDPAAARQDEEDEQDRQENEATEQSREERDDTQEELTRSREPFAVGNPATGESQHARQHQSRDGDDHSASGAGTQTTTRPAQRHWSSPDAPPRDGASPQATPSRRTTESSWTDKPNVEGEVLARGPNVFSEYRNLPDETDEAFTKDGWFRTGDLGRFDDDGFLYILGRASTLIITPGGKNIQPEAVEEEYESHEAIREAGILQKDDRLVALIVAQSAGGDSDEIEPRVRQAVEEVSRRLPSYQRVGDFALTHEPLPRTRLGKLQRHILKERYERAERGEEKQRPGPMSIEEMPADDRSLLDEHAARAVWDWLAERFKDRPLTPDTSPHLDLGVDSLEWLNLTMEISQRAGVELDDDAIGRVETVRDLLREVVEASAAGPGGKRADPLEDPEEALDERNRRWLRPLGPVTSALARLGHALNRAVMRVFYRVEARGLEHLPQSGPCLIAPNHVSFLDPFAIAAVLDSRRRDETYWGGWTGWAFANPIVRFASRLGRVLPVDPRRAVISSLALGAAVLKRGHFLVWFPEGHRSSTGELQEFRPGVGMLAAHFDAPIVPVFVHGAYEALPRGRYLPRPGKIVIVFGEPLRPGDLDREGEGEGEQRHDRIASALRERVRALGERGLA